MRASRPSISPPFCHRGMHCEVTNTPVTESWKERRLKRRFGRKLAFGLKKPRFLPNVTCKRLPFYYFFFKLRHINELMTSEQCSVAQWLPRAARREHRNTGTARDICWSGWQSHRTLWFFFPRHGALWARRRPHALSLRCSGKRAILPIHLLRRAFCAVDVRATASVFAGNWCFIFFPSLSREVFLAALEETEEGA